MRKSVFLCMVFAVIFMSSFIAQGLVQCAQCAKMVDPANGRWIDATELEFRKLYADHFMGHIKRAHLSFISQHDETSLDCEKFFEFYHIIAANRVFDESIQAGRNAAAALIEVETELQSRGLPGSIGDLLPYHAVRKDIQDAASGLRVSAFEFQPAEDDLEIRLICNECLVGKLPYSRQRNLRAVIPYNIQLGLKFDQIVRSSNIVIILHQQTSSLSANQFLIDYLKLFSSKSFVLGIDTIDDETGSTASELTEIRETLVEKFDEWNNEVKKNSCSYRDLIDLISAFGLPVLDLNKYQSRDWHQLDSNNIGDLLNFVEKRCRNVVCFALETPLSSLIFLDENAYNRAVDNHYGLLKQACEEFQIPTPALRQAKTSHKPMMKSQLYPVFNSSLANRNEIARKICAYFSAINRSGGSHNDVPLIVTVNSYHGILRDENGYFDKEPNASKREQLIQSLVRKKLADMGLTDVRVTTILANYDPRIPRIYSREKNMELNDFSLDYVMFFGKW
ncbi:hypothetical protein P0136_05460 [Lentisphaerota bacterium ZTH]|nr:hypothetical protein JYG24_03425 [Lentisphaerota bacterium]WET07438.1 hypothetical protein P0136_05460 [Lentisphaerota bacterium ZTH]